MAQYQDVNIIIMKNYLEWSTAGGDKKEMTTTTLSPYTCVTGIAFARNFP